MGKKKVVLDQFDFIRAIACLGIVLYHFAVEYGWPDIFNNYVGGVTYGDIYVTVFFFISGALLFYNHSEVDDLKLFYKKRALSIFPAFYIAWGLMYIRDVLRYKSLFYRGNPASIILSLIGMDGYLAFKINDYYILGEWFIGAIILLYILYPLLTWMKREYKWVTFGLVILLYILSLKINLTGMVSFRMLPSCLISFYAGMLFVEHRKRAEKYWWIAGILLVILKCIEPGNMNIKGHIAGFLMAYMLYGIGTYLMKINIINKVMKFIGGISYEAFLTHHVTICLFIKFVPADATVMMRVILLIAILAATGISAVVLKQVCKTIMSLGRARKKNIA